MKTIQVKVDVRDDVDIDGFLDCLVGRSGHGKVEEMLLMVEGQSILQGLENLAAKREQLLNVKAEFRNQPETNMALSKWLVAAEEQLLYPVPDSKDKADPEAIAAANKKPSDKDADDDYIMDD